ncbi:MAG: ATP-binding protein [Paludibacteraceae bacterium]|nr:ATP-binding protein [Paludibacteraceae bacterium]
MAQLIYIPRRLESVITEAAQYFSVISVTGPRQSGKSTMLKHLFPTLPRYSMKDLHVQAFAEQDPVAFLNQHKEGMFIDEVQKMPMLLDYIQGIVDDDPSRRFVLTGSSNLELLQGLTESLPGRAGVYELLPMSMEETAEQIADKNTNQLLYDGLYPAICARKNVAHLLYPAYVKTYLEKDVRDLLRIKDQMQFLKFMKLCAARIGSLFNASEVAMELGVDSKTVSHWLSVLQASYLVTLLPPYYENITKRVVKTPKLYFNDPGLACYLLDIESPKQLELDKMRGAIFENLVVMECIKHRFNQGKEGNVFFYRDSNGQEVDILVKEEGQLTAIEVKSSMTYKADFAKTLKMLPQWTSTPIVRRSVVYGGDFENVAGDIWVLRYNHINQLF